MSKRRREWNDLLKQDIEKERKKIQILNDEVYKNVNGEMILVSTQTNEMETKNNNTFQEYNNTLQQDCNKTLQMSPSQSLQKFDTENLTPTFRKPDFFLAETKEIMKIITPVKLFPECSETQLKENFTIIAPYNIEQDKKTQRDFSHLRNIELILSEHNGKMEINENIFHLTELTSANEETNNIKKKDYENQEVDLINSNCDSNEANSTTNNILEQSLKIIVNPEIHEPREINRGRVNSKNYEKVLIEHNINDEDNIVVAPEDKMNTLNLPSSEASDTVLATETKQNSRVKRSRRNIHYDKSYLDYMSDEDLDQLLLDEAFPSEASSEDYDTEESTDLSKDQEKDQKGKVKKGKKKIKKDVKIKINTETEAYHNISAHKKESKTTIRLENKNKRKMGQAYINTKGELMKSKAIRPNPCIEKNCGNECGNISEKRRESLFSYFWNLNSHQRRKDWIAQSAVRKSIKKPSNDNNIRSCAYDYFINEGEGRRKVCQKYLINTLDITQRFILYTLGTMTDGYAKTDERGINGGHNRTKEEVIKHARNFIESLPTMPSHYCRKDSKRLYFSKEFRNLTNLFRIYKSNCKDSEIKGMSFQVFRSWFKKSYNIGFHIPKKDKCFICSNNKNSEKKTEEEKEKIERHVKEKDESYKRFKYHQIIHGKDKSIICASFDMQKVLNTPYGDSMMLYYSRKFAVYNFTIYESTTRKGYCNVWTETDARRGANEICTCLYNYIKDVDSRDTVKTLLLYCDSCYGQNKNKFVLSMIRYALSQCKNIKTIQINYLIPGHTYMPVDSVHATIETQIRKCTIWAPSQWPTIMEVARHDPEPYRVEVLNGKDFIGFDDVINATFKKNLKIAISKLNIATFKKQEPNVMYIKNSMLPDAEITEIPLLPLKDVSGLKKNLYPTQLGISVNKYKDLKNLVDKNIIPSRFAAEYKNLKTNNKVKDCLEDTDEEDDVIEIQHT